jgi:hypothetical protein
MVAHWQADFFEGFTAGGHEGVFVEGVGFAAWESGLACIY